MSLAFRAGDLHQVAVRELDRAGQNGTGDRDLIVTGEAADDLVGRIVDGCEFRTKLRKRRGLDLPDEVGEHVVEKANLFGVEIACVAEKKIGHAPENFGTPVARARGKNIFEFFNDGRGLRHFLSWAGFFPPPFTDWRGSSPARCRTWP